MTRLFYLSLAFLLLAHPWALAAHQPASQPASQPNVILIMTDDQGYGDMSCHGNPYLQTPNIDALYRDSVRLTDFHVDPTCSPTRAALMTGRYSSRVGVWLTYGGRHHLRADEVTMADIFSAAGYRTAIYGKWHLGDNYPFRPRDRGFHESLIHGGGVAGEAPDRWGNDYYDDIYLRNGDPEPTEGYCTDVWFDETIRFIEQKQTQPFFVYLPTNAPHGPHNVPWEYAEPFAKDSKTNERVARYYGMLVNIDDNIGRLRRRLTELDLAENTLVVFLTDNGGTAGVRLFNAGMRAGKGKPYDGGHRAACFLHWPAGKLTGGKDVKPITAHIDLLPTLAELCHLPSPHDIRFDGKSLVSVLHGDKVGWPERTLLVHHQGRFGQKIQDDRPIKHKDFAVMTDRWRLVGKELYDIQIDPGQQNDIADEHPDVVHRLSAVYEGWWTDISTHFDEYCRTVIGSEHQSRTMLTCQDWHGEVIPYNQQHVRAAVEANGFWDLKVAAAGDYEISLRRWPEELDLPIDAMLPEPDLDPQKHDVLQKMFGMPSGVVPAEKARLKIGSFDQTVPVQAGAKRVAFRVTLPTGAVQLQTWLIAPSGKSWGAYYVYVEKL